MNFLNIGPAELVLVLVVALVVFGPNRLPGLARDLARAAHEFQSVARGLTAKVEGEMRDEALRLPPDQGSGTALTDRNGT